MYIYAGSPGAPDKYDKGENQVLLVCHSVVAPLFVLLVFLQKKYSEAQDDEQSDGNKEENFRNPLLALIQRQTVSGNLPKRRRNRTTPLRHRVRAFEQATCGGCIGRA